jgi:asparagine synthase (glutamine-hydrolysing)
MCGIAGIASPQPDRGIGEICLAMRDAMVHRGPDDAGLHVSADGNVALASRRLAIIDLTPAGHQPMLSGDGRLAVVFNGEIYNYRDLRTDLLDRGHRLLSESDTEVILHLYEESGPSCLDRLNGMFALALWDDPEHTLLLARDRLGKKPLIYAHLSDGSLAFASEFQGLLRHPAIPSQSGSDRLFPTLRLRARAVERLRGRVEAKPGPSPRLARRAHRGRSLLGAARASATPDR